MRMKSFYARDVTTALALARQELGPEAMLVDSRKAPPEARHLGDCEVIMAVGVPTPAAVGGGGTASDTAAPPAGPVFPQYSSLASEVSELRRQMERIAHSVARSNVLTSAHRLPEPELTTAFSELLESGLDAELAHSILNRVRQEGVPCNRENLRLATAAEVAGRFRTAPALGVSTMGRKIAALVGPCGAGKTTALVKLAARFGLATRRPSHIISADTYRVGATEQLRAYAAVLGISFQAVDSVRALQQALEELRHKDLVLIDTPGHGFRDLDAAEELAEFLVSRNDVDIHLVLTASMRSADLSRVTDRFELFRPAKLLFTRLDETESFGPLLNEAVRTGKPVSFLSGGQRIPEDLEPATKERIIDLVLNRR